MSRRIEHPDFTRRLGAMARDAQLLQNRRGDWLIPDKADLIRGRVEGHPDGFGFLVPDDGGADLFLATKEMDKVLHGDRAIARVVGIDRKGRPEGKIVEVVERANSKVVGRVHRGARRLVRRRREPAHQPGHPAGAGGEGARRRPSPSPARSWWWN